MKEYTVTLTKEDLMNQTRGDCAKCAVALAVQRVFPNNMVTVGYKSVTAYFKDYYLSFVLPKEITDFIVTNDNNRINLENFKDISFIISTDDFRHNKAVNWFCKIKSKVSDWFNAAF